MKAFLITDNNSLDRKYVFTSFAKAIDVHTIIEQAHKTQRELSELLNGENDFILHNLVIQHCYLFTVNELIIHINMILHDMNTLVGQTIEETGKNIEQKLFDLLDVKFPKLFCQGIFIYYKMKPGQNVDKLYIPIMMFPEHILICDNKHILCLSENIFISADEEEYDKIEAL